MRGPKDPFARKMVFGSFVYGGVLLVMFAVMTVVYLHTRPRCSDRVLVQAFSPDRRWIATLMERRCGEEAPFFAHVNLRPAGTELKRGIFSGAATEGEVFQVEQDAIGAGVAFQWTSAGTLAIDCARCSPSLMRKQDGRWRDVTIRYQVPSR